MLLENGVLDNKNKEFEKFQKELIHSVQTHNKKILQENGELITKAQLKKFNKKMKASVENEDVKYGYVIEDGISNVKSGFQVLKNLNYPESILEKVFSFN